MLKATPAASAATGSACALQATETYAAPLTKATMSTTANALSLMP